MKGNRLNLNLTNIALGTLNVAHFNAFPVQMLTYDKTLRLVGEIYYTGFALCSSTKSWQDIFVKM